MRKVKFTQDTFDEKLGRIISEFPVLDVCPLPVSFGL
jgi:nucleolar GTP-binding protein